MHTHDAAGVDVGKIRRNGSCSGLNRACALMSRTGQVKMEGATSSGYVEYEKNMRVWNRNCGCMRASTCIPRASCRRASRVLCVADAAPAPAPAADAAPANSERCSGGLHRTGGIHRLVGLRRDASKLMGVSKRPRRRRDRRLRLGQQPRHTRPLCVRGRSRGGGRRLLPCNHPLRAGCWVCFWRVPGRSTGLDRQGRCGAHHVSGE